MLFEQNVLTVISSSLRKASAGQPLSFDALLKRSRLASEAEWSGFVYEGSVEKNNFLHVAGVREKKATPRIWRSNQWHLARQPLASDAPVC